MAAGGAASQQKRTILTFLGGEKTGKSVSCGAALQPVLQEAENLTEGIINFASGMLTGSGSNPVTGGLEEP